MADIPNHKVGGRSSQSRGDWVHVGGPTAAEWRELGKLIFQRQWQTQRSPTEITCLWEKTEVCGLAVGASLYFPGFPKSRGEGGGLSKNHTASQICRKLWSMGSWEVCIVIKPLVALLHGLERLRGQVKLYTKCRVSGKLLLGWNKNDPTLSRLCAHTPLPQPAQQKLTSYSAI